MEPVCRFLEQGPFSLDEVLQMMNEHLGQDGGALDEVVLPEPGGIFVE